MRTPEALLSMPCVIRSWLYQGPGLGETLQWKKVLRGTQEGDSLKGYESQGSKRCGGVQERPSDQQAGARLIHGSRESDVPYL